MNVYALGPFTNGHEAAFKFIEIHGSLATAETIFCGSHAEVFRRLIESPGFAVVPVQNSIKGEVTEVVEQLRRLREMGYVLKQRFELDLPINHCLLASCEIHDVRELTGVYSHPQALGQCSRYLNGVGLTSDKQVACPSTGVAAEKVAIEGKSSTIGAIAPKIAAEKYGLQIIAEGIQDEARNCTKFLLLENEAIVSHRFR